jgi:hypothetical protein
MRCRAAWRSSRMHLADSSESLAPRARTSSHPPKPPVTVSSQWSQWFPWPGRLCTVPAGVYRGELLQVAAHGLPYRPARRAFGQEGSRPAASPAPLPGRECNGGYRGGSPASTRGGRCASATAATVAVVLRALAVVGRRVQRRLPWRGPASTRGSITFEAAVRSCSSVHSATALPEPGCSRSRMVLITAIRNIRAMSAVTTWIAAGLVAMSRYPPSSRRSRYSEAR